MIRNRNRKFEFRNLTLEQRIARLEKAIVGNKTSRRRVNEGLDVNFRVRVETAVGDILGDYYFVRTKISRGALFVYVEDEEAANGYEYGIAGDFRVDEDPDGYVVSVTDSTEKPNYECGTARDADEVAEIITDQIAEYCDDL